MNSSVAEKLERGITLGLILGVLTGFFHLLWFLLEQNYRVEELRFAGFNLLYGSVHAFVFYALIGCFALTMVWLVFRRLEGLILAALVAGAVFIPVAYLVNVRFLPGIRETASLIGNGLMGLAAIAVMVVVFRKWTADKKFVELVTGRYLLTATVILYVGSLAAYRLQPTHRQLYVTPDSPQALLEVLDVAKIREALGVQNGIAPSHLLKQYFELRAEERSARLRRKIMSRDTTAIVAYADSILKRKFTFVGQSHQLSHEIDWRRNPTSDKVWLFSLNRQEWLWDIAVAYLLSNDPKYALAFEEILHGWFEQNPRIDWKNEDDPVWRLIESSLRMSSSWIDAFTVFFPCDEIDDALKWRMLGSFYEHGQFLAHFRSPGKNHLIQESYGLLAVAGAFPEFKTSANWLELANLRLDESLSSEIYPDGGYIEGSTFYHRFVVRILQQIADFADEFEVKLSAVFYERLERMYTFLMQVARPDGVMPQVNDGFRAKSLRPLYQYPAGMFDRLDFEFFASEGERGQEPEMRSIGFPYSGVYVMRSDWSPEARYMIVDAGLFGSSHGHEDKLSFELFAYGKPFIVEGGTYTYKYDRWHRYFESSFAHNTMVVDQRSQLRMANESTWASETPEELPNVWHSNELFDYVEASYDDGYGNHKESMLHGLKHTRRILFVKPDYWIIWDVLSGDGEYAASQLFHFAPEAQVRVENDRDVVATYDKGPQLTLKSLNPADVALKKVVGSESPIQGWVSPEYGVKVEAAAVDFETKGTLPRTFVTILFPSAGKEAIPFEAELVTVANETGPIELSDAIGIRIDFSRSMDFILIAPDAKGELRFENQKSSHQLYLRREKEDGQTVEMGVPN